MSNAVATVAFLQGQAWAKSPDGSLRPLALGSALIEGEILVTAQGAQVQLDFGDGAPVSIDGGQEVAMSRDFNADTATGTDEALLDGASIEQALTVLEQGGDLLAELEETAAGDTSGGGSGGGSSFVRLTRVLETTDPLAFNYNANSVDQASDVPREGRDTGYQNRAPEVVDQILSGDEDEVITGNVIASDIENDTLNYSLATGPVNGTLVLDAATGQFSFTPNANYNGSDSFVVTVADSHGNSSVVTINLNILPVNDAPVSSDIQLTTDEDTPVTGQVIAEDVEGDTLTYTVSGQPANGTVTLDPATGTFVYVPNADYNGSDGFVVTINDGNGGTTTSLVTIGINPVNDVPVSSNQHLVTDEDTPVSGQVVASDVDRDALGYSITGQPTNGTVSLNPTTGGFVYTPNADYNGSDSFVVTIDDSNGGTTTSLITIGINPVNDAPASNDQGLTTNEDTPLSGQVVASDVDGDTLTYNVSGQPAHGTVTLNAATGGFVYTPTPNYNGSDSFVVTIRDGNGGTTTSHVNIGVIPVNDAPVSSNLNLTTDEDTPVPGAISASDPDGDTLSYVVTGNPSNGTVVLNTATGTFTYTPATGYTGSDSFVVTVSDGNGGTTTSTVNIGVNAVNHAPMANDDSATTNESTAVTVLVRGNDTDPDGDSLTVTAVTQGAKGSVVIDSVTGNPIYTPNAGFTGTDSFTYTISDGSATASAVVTVTVNPAVPVNQAPVAVADSITVAEGGTVSTLNGGATSVLANDTDADGDPLAAILVSGPANGSLVLNANGTFSYTHNGSKTTTDSFTYRANDGSSDGNIVTVNITVTPVNDAPETNDVSAIGNEDALVVLTLSGTDADGSVIGYVVKTLPANGVLYADSAMNQVISIGDLVAGPVYFMPATGWAGRTSFTYSARDNDGLEDATPATVNITINAGNTAPVANEDSTVPTLGVQIGLISEYFGYREGPDGANLSSIEQAYSFISGRTPDATFTARTFDYGVDRSFTTGLGYGTNLQTFLGADAASLSNDPGNTSDAIIRMRGFVDLDAGTYNFKVTADDGYQIRIDGVVVAEYNKNNQLHETVHSQFTINTPGLHAVEIVYWDQGGYATLKVELSDNSGVSYDIMSSIPAYQTSALTVLEDQSLSIPAASLLANDTDADGDTLSIVSVQAGVNGSVALVGSDVVFSPAANYSGPASFTYTISDGRGGTATATVKLVVAPVNDAPVAVGDNVSVKTDGKLEIPFATLTANDTDIDGDKLSIVSVQDALNGTVAISHGKVVFTPMPGYEGPASFTYTVRDHVGATSTATVNVGVGNATAPSVVVVKTLLAIAHGTGGTSVSFPIITKLVDTDGSESLSIKISGVTGGLSFNAGTNLGGGVWQFTEADLAGLTLSIPGGFNVGSHKLSVAVTSTEVNGGFTATTSTTVALKSTFTHVDITTTESGSFTGTSSNEFIQGGSGENVINAGNGNNIIYGNAGNDTLTAGDGSDIIYGGAGNDIINSGTGTDRIIGGAGNDIMQGGAAGENFVDVFVWSLGDQGAAGAPAMDTIINFATNPGGGDTIGGDVLDLRDLLQGESIGPANSAGNLTNYLHFEVSGGNTIIHVSHMGGFDSGYTSGAETQQITLTGVDLQSLYSATTDQQIITQLLNNHKLITD